MDVMLYSGPAGEGVQFDAACALGAAVARGVGAKPVAPGRTVLEKIDAPVARTIACEGPQIVFVLIVDCGGATIVSSNMRTHLSPGDVAILAQGEDRRVECHGGSSCRLIRTPRRAIQGLASAACGRPCRLSNVNLIVPAPGCPRRATEAALRMEQIVCGSAPEQASERRALELEWNQALVDLLRQLDDERGDVFATAGSVARGIAYIRQRAPVMCSMLEIASVAGVTPITLRKNFRACLDMSVTAFEQRARLDWAMTSLLSAKESRSIAQMATAAGYRSSQAFTTAFQRLFGESPSAVRSRTVKENHAA